MKESKSFWVYILPAFSWIIRTLLIISFIGIVIAATCPNLSASLRVTAIGLMLQVAGITFAIPELAELLRLNNETTGIVWGVAFKPIWSILSRVNIKMTLGQLVFRLSIFGVSSILAGLIMQYISIFLK
jgi:hypothetical protein